MGTHKTKKAYTKKDVFLRISLVFYNKPDSFDQYVDLNTYVCKITTPLWMFVVYQRTVLDSTQFGNLKLTICRNYKYLFPQSRIA